MSDTFKIEIDLNILNHLGIGLYSNTPAVLTEIVANAWDADAKNVDIVINPQQDEIIIKDDGHGMDSNDVQKKFLTVGYARRQHGEAITPGQRQCMGRKGIGKLAMFSLANNIEVITLKEGGLKEGFSINIEDLKNNIQKNLAYEPEPIFDTSSYNLGKHGTEIRLKNLTKNINKSESYLRTRLARRFSVIGPGNNFQIILNNSTVKLEDRGFYRDIQLLWTFGSSKAEIENLCNNKVKSSHFDGLLQTPRYTVNGFIGGVVKPEQLKKDDCNNNTITLISNGRIFVEDIKKSIDDSKVFNSYLVGELQVDFIDSNESDDIAVSSRQGVNENDPRYIELMNYVKNCLSVIANNWSDWRRDIGSKDVEDDFPKVTEWMEGLSDKHKKRAKQLIGKINTIRFDGSEEKQREQKKEIIKHQILAFEKLRIQDNIEDVTNINLAIDTEDFKNILLSVEDLEASMQHDLIEQRLSVIKKLKEQIDERVKERIVQEHIYEHLWLIDPTWGYKGNTKQQEKNLTMYLKKACPDTEEGARFDIGYHTMAGRYVVIELKKPGLSVQFDKLCSQGEKYVTALEKYFEENPGTAPLNGSVPSIEVIFLIDKSPISSGNLRDRQLGRLKLINAQILTYNDLVNQAMLAYEDHLKVIEQVDRIRRITESL